MDQLSWFPFDDRIRHHILERFDEASAAGRRRHLRSGHARRRAAVHLHPGLPDAPPGASSVEPSRCRAPRSASRAGSSTWVATSASRSSSSWHVPMGLDHELFSVRVPPTSVATTWGCGTTPTRRRAAITGWRALREAQRQVPGCAPCSSAPRRSPTSSRARPSGLPWLDVRLGLDQQGLADEVFNQTRVFLQSSVHEGFGYTAVEAMACGAAPRDHRQRRLARLRHPRGDGDRRATAGHRRPRRRHRRARLRRRGPSTARRGRRAARAPVRLGPRRRDPRGSPPAVPRRSRGLPGPPSADLSRPE